MRYPIRFPLASVFARFGATLVIHVNFFFDPAAKVFIATSTDVPGLVIEAGTFVELKHEVEEAIPNLLSLNNKKLFHKTSADVVFKDHLAIA